MEEVSLNAHPDIDDEGYEHESEEDCSNVLSNGCAAIPQGKSKPLPPAVGMEFESFDDAYNFYNCYAKEHGFGIRVRSSWFRSKSKERYRSKLCCSSAGFKKKSDANRPRPETRTGCPAMITIKLMDSKRWRVIEVELEHNHILGSSSIGFYKSHKKMGLGIKRTLESDCAVEVQTIKLYRTPVVDAGGYGSSNLTDNGSMDHDDQPKQLKLKEGDAQAVYGYFSHMQLMDPNFFYVMDLNDEGCLRNMFWIDARSRAAYGYFSDIVAVDTKFLRDKYEVPLVAFLGVNHHGQSVLLGCGVLADDSVESFVWLFRAWITCMLGRPPHVIITDHCETLQCAVADVFPRSRHCFCLSSIMQRVPEKLGGLRDYDAIKLAFNKAIYDSMRVEEFDAVWEDMIQHYRVREHNWLQALYEDRRRWAPVYLKDAFLAGISPLRHNKGMASVFDGHVHKDTTWKEFVNKYDQALQRTYQEEAMADLESRNSNFELKTACSFELQLSKIYTKEIFNRFQQEVEQMNSCLSTRQVLVNGSVMTYIVKERVELEGNQREIIDFEVIYNTTEGDVRCICCLLNTKGYLCRHALSVLDYNGVEEIPSQYILSRWRKDVKRTYVLNHSTGGVDVNNPVQWYDHLFKRVIQLVEEGAKSEEHYKVALQILEDSLNKVRSVETTVIENA